MFPGALADWGDALAPQHWQLWPQQPFSFWQVPQPAPWPLFQS
jgi:hypothetical protein